MKIISFDVGIKNMGYCIFDLSNSVPYIAQWEIMDLIEENNTTMECSHILKNNKKCNKKATYKKNTTYFCNVHSKQCKYWLPSKEFTKGKLNKKTIDELLQLCKQYHIAVEKYTKQECCIKLVEFYNNNVLEKLDNKKKKCDEYDLVHLGKRIKYYCDNRINSDVIDYVLIENQISPIANRMKTIQGMLAQYFIMKNDNVKIIFVSSQNKLKYFDKHIDPTATSTYKANKKNGIFYCNELLSHKYDYLQNWKSTLEVKKKDDLADAFLQGIWYIENKINI
jgi:hypothetical protein